jgi:hypothetical protein
MVTMDDMQVRPFLTPEERLYVFADVARSSFRLVMWSVPKVSGINGFGVERLLQCAPEPDFTFQRFALQRWSPCFRHR